MSPECLKDLNFIMNHLIMVGGQYKATRRDFIAAGDHGIAAFLRAEGMERYEMSGDVADYIQQNNGDGVRFAAEPAPAHGKASMQMLQNLVKLEKATVDKLDEFIALASDRGSVITQQYMVWLRNYCQYEHNEVKGVVDELTAIAADPGSLLYYNNFLEKKYGSKYDNPRKYH